MTSIQINQNIPSAAIVMEDNDNLLVDLRISGPIDVLEPSDVRYLIWSKHEDQLFGIVRLRAKSQSPNARSAKTGPAIAN